MTVKTALQEWLLLKDCDHCIIEGKMLNASGVCVKLGKWQCVSFILGIELSTALSLSAIDNVHYTEYPATIQQPTMKGSTTLFLMHCLTSLLTTTTRFQEEFFSAVILHRVDNDMKQLCYLPAIKACFDPCQHTLYNTWAEILFLVIHLRLSKVQGWYVATMTIFSYVYSAA